MDLHHRHTRPKCSKQLKRKPHLLAAREENKGFRLQVRFYKVVKQVQFFGYVDDGIRLQTLRWRSNLIRIGLTVDVNILRRFQRQPTKLLNRFAQRGREQEGLSAGREIRHNRVD